MKSSLNVNWAKGMAFETELNGHKLTVDTNEEFGGNDTGPRPKALMMFSLAGCSGMDVVSILKKMKVELEDFNMIVEAEMADEHPKMYTSMHVRYQFKGKDLDITKLKKAVDLSQEKYCGVSASYQKSFPVTYEIEIL